MDENIIRKIEQALKHNLREHKKAANQSRRKQREILITRVRQYSAESADELLANAGQAHALLTSPAESTRYAAMLSIAFLHPRDHSLVHLVERILENENSERVCELALIHLGNCYEGSYDVRIGSRIADFADQHRSPKLRQAAIGALRSIGGYPTSQRFKELSEGEETE